MLIEETVHDTEQDFDGQDGIQIVTFSLDKARFAVPMALVQEIVRVPDTVRVPLASEHLLGLANLRGRVLPVFQCRTMMGLCTHVVDEASRVLVLRLSGAVGLVVDRVHAVMTIGRDEIETLNAHDDFGDREWLTGVVRQKEQLTLLLDVEQLVKANACQQDEMQAAPSSFQYSDSVQGIDEDDNQDELQLVSFEVDSQEYAAPIEQVKEIVQAPVNITRLPHTPDSVLGVMVLRNRLLPLISLRAVFGLTAIDLQEHHRVVVLQLGAGTAIGVVMDRVNEVIRIPKSIQEPVPTIFQGSGSVKHVQSMCRLEDGKRLVSIIETGSLAVLANLAFAQMSTESESLADSSVENTDGMEEGDMDDEGQVVVFRLGDEEFGVNIHLVQEIVRVPEQLTRIPQAPEFLEGVINLRGSVLPVIDQRRRMGIPSIARHDRQRIMVYLMNGVRTGFVVDSVTEVLRIDAADITATPTGGLHDVGLLPKVANLTDSKRMILLIDPNELLSTDEITLAGQIDSGVHQAAQGLAEEAVTELVPAFH